MGTKTEEDDREAFCLFEIQTIRFDHIAPTCTREQLLQRTLSFLGRWGRPEFFYRNCSRDQLQLSRRTIVSRLFQRSPNIRSTRYRCPRECSQCRTGLCKFPTFVGTRRKRAGWGKVSTRLACGELSTDFPFPFLFSHFPRKAPRTPCQCSSQIPLATATTPLLLRSVLEQPAKPVFLGLCWKEGNDN